MNLRRWLYKHAFWLYKLADDYRLNLEIDKTVDEIEELQKKLIANRLTSEDKKHE